MSINQIAQYNSGPTTNDLLESLVVKHASLAQDDRIAAKTAEDTQDIEDAPAISGTASDTTLCE
jgi:hypothetical protein